MANSANPLIKLPDEIQLAIIKYLYNQDAGLANSSVDPKLSSAQSPTTQQEAHPSPSQNHPNTPEPPYRPISLLLALSSTCKFYRALLIPHIFRSVTLRETADSGEAVRGLLERGYGEHVRELRFVAWADDASGEIEEWETEFRNGGEDESGEGGEEGGRDREEAVGESGNEDAEEEEKEGESSRGDQDDKDEQESGELMSMESYSILSNLKRFPHLHALIVAFDMDLASWDKSIQILMNPETSKDILRREKTQGWRMLLRKTFDALVENEPGFKSLELRNLVPKAVSTWKGDKWRRFLGGLREVDISIMGGDNGAGWNINTQSGYSSFIAKMPAAMIDHLQAATSLRLAGPLSGPLEGPEECNFNLVPLSLSPATLPSLVSLTLKHVFIDRMLVDFLVAHSLLEFLELNSCYSAPPFDWTESFQGWKTLFASLASAEPSNLREFVVSEMEEDISFGESSHGKIKMCEIPIEGNIDRRREETDEIKSIQRILQEERNVHGRRRRRLFSYKTVDDTYGVVDAAVEDTRALFLKGEDWAAYLKLMERIDRNRERIGVEKIEAKT